MNVPRLRHKTAIFVTFLIAGLLGGLAAGALAAEKQAPGFFRAGANVVLVNATVLDRNHRPVRGLTRDRFRIFENKVEQRIGYFGEEEMPLSLAVVFDTSGSMGGKIAGATRALRAMLNDPNGDDEFSLITFADRPEVAVPWTSDAVAVQNRAAATRAHGRTSLLDAIHLALTQLHRANNIHRAILILSDGGDNSSRYTERQITRMLAEADVQLYAVDMSPAAILRDMPPEEVRGPDLLGRLCDYAAGRYFQAENQRDLAKTVDQIGKEMRSQYVLGYAPSNSAADGLFRHVRLQLLPVQGGAKLSVYWRRGYRSPAQ